MENRISTRILICFYNNYLRIQRQNFFDKHIFNSNLEKKYIF